MWKVDGRRYLGRMDPQALAATTATRARATRIGACDWKPGDGDGDGDGKLGVVRPGDLPVRGEESTAHAAVWLGETHRRAPRDGA